AVRATELLDLSRLVAAVQLRAEPVELGEITRAGAAEFSLRAAERRAEIEVGQPEAACWVRRRPAAVPARLAHPARHRAALGAAGRADHHLDDADRAARGGRRRR